LAADGELLSDAERRDIDALIARAAEASAGGQHDAIHAAVEALARGTEAFAAARMNRGIRRALAGRSIEDV
jgi:molecular chaperone HscA